MASGFRGALTSWFETKVDHLNAGLVEVAVEASEKGENITKHHIETRGTAKSGKRGRIESSDMLNSVSHGIVKLSKDEVETRFGFKDSPYYTEFQEKGFVSWTGADVEGMYALSDASEEVLADLQEDIKRVVADA